MEDLQRIWDSLGRDDPLWAVLSFPEMRGNRWDAERFFASGREEVDALMARLAGLGLPAGRERCLDFGCGVGRLTQAFSQHFERSDGVDIAPSMIEHARRFNRFGERCVYHVNGRDDLSLFEDASFDLVYTRIVLQHVPPELSRRYIPEFVRLVRPGGLAVFHVPSGPSSAAGSQIVLPDSAYRAELRLARAPRLTRAGSPVELRVRVRNTGDRTWPVAAARGWFHVGNHWVSAAGRRRLRDDQRAELPGDVAPGQEVEVALPVTAPREPGLHALEVDLVHEGVTWFADRGSKRARTWIWVLPARSGAPEPAEPEVAFGMYSLPREEVLELVERAGGRLLTTVESDTGDFHDILYHVTRT